MNIKECLEQGLLSKTEPDIRKAKKSILAAERKLSLAEAELKAGIYENCFVTAYASMFHAARALLFRDGFKEKSHYAIYIYITESYSGRIEGRYFTEFNNMRTDRHNLMYGLDQPQDSGEHEAKAAIKIVKEFIELIKKEVE